ncbi:hypothetical protein Ciccas_012454 [Cichlidogyrus casuarinus]|uniref:Uncharacterized protein n=1 Tax=Cichlidogyrus casuarinus TaxID=1844966 RepID=A0ABD2PNT8_9PLAT
MEAFYCGMEDNETLEHLKISAVAQDVKGPPGQQQQHHPFLLQNLIENLQSSSSNYFLGGQAKMALPRRRNNEFTRSSELHHFWQ